MTPEKAISILSTVKNVKEWNEKRDFIKSQIDAQEWVSVYVPLIDGSGLIVNILGQD